MSKSLADLRQEKPSSRPERALTVCLKPDLVAELMALAEEHDYLKDQSAIESNSQGKRAEIAGRIGEIKGRIAELLEEIEGNEGELRLRALTDGEWRRWVNSHPARAEEEPGHARDQEVTFGVCNSDDLIDALDQFAYTWNGDRFADGDWAILADNIAGPDLKQAATAVVAMHESRLDFRQWRTALSASLRRLSDSGSPGNSALVPADSTGGNPEPSNVGSIETDSPAA